MFRYLIFLGQVGLYAEALGHAGHLIETYGAEGETFQQALTITAVGRCWAARAGHMDESLAYARRFRTIRKPGPSPGIVFPNETVARRFDAAPAALSVLTKR